MVSHLKKLGAELVTIQSFASHVERFVRVLTTMVNVQLRIEMFNATNTRNFGIPDGRVNSANFLNEKGTNGGNRFIWLSARYVF